MRWHTSTGAVVAVAMAIAVTLTPAVAGQQAPPAGTAAGSAGTGSYLNLAPRRRLPQRPLIEVPPPGAMRPDRAAKAGPRVVCGTTLVPGDSSIDPGIQARVAPPTARPTIRAVEPPICWPASPR